MFPEQQQLEEILIKLGSHARVTTLAHIRHQNQELPITCISLGSERPDVPVLVYCGGIHGLEKIGSEVLLAYLHTLTELLNWDEQLHDNLHHLRILFIPIVNPVGVWRGTRCNGNGVDLMRNAPIEAAGKTKLYGGHRMSAHLPWFRGHPDTMEQEIQVLCDVIRNQITQCSRLLVLDLHSGFGMQDRLWFPYAYSQTPFPNLAEAHALKHLFDQSYPHHFYKIEPMSQTYIISGDLWDYLYIELQRSHPDRLFMPLTLEMGSWQWLRKNPLHLLHRHGLFHPMLPHRHQRILRRHLTLFDFLMRAMLHPKAWARLDSIQQVYHQEHALRLWYA